VPPNANLVANAPANLLANERWKMPWWTPDDGTELHDMFKTANDKWAKIG